MTEENETRPFITPLWPLLVVLGVGVISVNPKMAFWVWLIFLLLVDKYIIIKLISNKEDEQ